MQDYIEQDQDQKEEQEEDQKEAHREAMSEFLDSLGAKEGAVILFSEEGDATMMLQGTLTRRRKLPSVLRITADRMEKELQSEIEQMMDDNLQRLNVALNTVFEDACDLAQTTEERLELFKSLGGFLMNRLKQEVEDVKEAVDAEDLAPAGTCH